MSIQDGITAEIRRRLMAEEEILQRPTADP